MRKAAGTWAEFEPRFCALVAERHIADLYAPSFFAVPTALLCIEATAVHCHRWLVLEHLQRYCGNLEAVHF